jgi:hypothetical protein
MDNETLEQLIRFRRHWLSLGDTIKFQNLNAVVSKVRQAAMGADGEIHRELPIQWNGNVPVSGSVNRSAGNLKSQAIEELWLQINDFLRDHCATAHKEDKSERHFPP